MKPAPVEFNADTSLVKPADGVAVALADLVAAGTKLTVTGLDLSAIVKKDSLSDTAVCSDFFIRRY